MNKHPWEFRVPFPLLAVLALAFGFTVSLGFYAGIFWLFKEIIL